MALHADDGIDVSFYKVHYRFQKGGDARFEVSLSAVLACWLVVDMYDLKVAG